MRGIRLHEVSKCYESLLKTFKDKEKTMATQLSSDQLVGILRDTVVSLVRRDGVDLSARQ
jgi:hypothetical protein